MSDARATAVANQLPTHLAERHTRGLLALLDKVIEHAACMGAVFGADLGNSKAKETDTYKILVREVFRPPEKAP